MEFFSPRQMFLSLCSGKINFLNFFFSCKFGCQIEFGAKIVIPDPDSRVKFEPLKLVQTLECILFWCLHIDQDPTNMGSDRGKFTKVKSFDKRGALGLCSVFYFF